jgi:hypothetical protein
MRINASYATSNKRETDLSHETKELLLPVPVFIEPKPLVLSRLLWKSINISGPVYKSFI